MGSVPFSYTRSDIGLVASGVASWTSGSSTITVTINYGISSIAGWKIVGRQSQGDYNTYIDAPSGTSTRTFTQTATKKEYVFQVNFGGYMDNSGDGIFTVDLNDDSGNSGGGDSGGSSGGGSSGGGSSSSTGPFTLYINEGVGTKIDFRRSWPQNRLCNEPLSTGEKIYYDGEDTFYIYNFEALEGYTLDVDTYEYGIGLNNLEYYTEDANYYYWQLASGADASLTTVGIPNQYKLTISESAGSTLTVTRISTNHKSASIGTISNGSPIYHDDVLQITYNIDTGYFSDVKIGNTTISSGDTYTVTGNTTISTNTSVKSYELTLVPDTGVTITVNRTSSPLKGAANKTWTTYEQEETYSDIYYGDVLTITAESDAEYKINLQQINGSSFVSGTTHTIADNVYIVAITELSGIVHIFDGASFNNYIIQIFNGSTWDQYIPYVFDCANWSVCS